MVVVEIGCVVWIQQTGYMPMANSFEHSNEPLDCIKGREFLDHLNSFLRRTLFSVVS
jgi:hypothetical protein